MANHDSGIDKLFDLIRVASRLDADPSVARYGIHVA